MADIEYFYSAHSVFTYFGSARLMEIARAADSQIIHKPIDLNRVVETNGPGWTGSLTPARYAYFFGRYVTFQLAEVAVPRELFRKILGLIDDLRPRPAPA